MNSSSTDSDIWGKATIASHHNLSYKNHYNGALVLKYGRWVYVLYLNTHGYAEI